jgi:hypothetical protein
MSTRMRTPGFTAESSLYLNGKPYPRRAPALHHSGEQTATPQQFGRYRCSSYDEHGCRQCCDIRSGFCWWKCIGDPVLM